jgi:chaperonin GroES
MAKNLAYNRELDGDADKLGKGRGSRKTAQNLADIAEYDGNLAERLSEQDRKRMAEEAVREYEHDEKSREEWLHGVDRAIKNARQKPEKKNYPFEGASNIKYPLLTTAMNQFGARAYGAITRSDQPMICKVVGEDPQGLKAKRADRLSRFGNFQLMYMMDEWDSGTDKLLHMLPVIGAGFRKGYWRADMGRPTLEFTSAKDVVVANDAPSFDRAPRMTQPTTMYPYEIDRLIGSGKWLNHKRDYEGQKDEDSQKPCIYLEQVRYYDLDGDGMMEPYIATISKDDRELVRLEAAFWANSIRVNSMDGKVETIMRESPWIDYSFLPDIEGSVYGMGFGQLLESLGSAINTALNQIFDAAHRQNAGGGFISQGLRLRGGEVRIKPAEFLNVNVPGRVSDAIHELQFAGPSPVLFQLVEFLLGAAADITSVKDVMTGEAPSGQAMGATLALIEQGMQVFSTIYTRIYRAMRKEFRLLMRLNARYLDPAVYAEFLDDEELFLELMGMPPPGSQQMPMMGMGGPAMPGMQQRPSGLMVPNGMMPPGAPEMPQQPEMGAQPPMPGAGMMQPQQPQQRPQPVQLSPEALAELAKDFDLKNMDVAPGADPRSVTDMQRMMRAQYLAQFKGQPGIDNRWIQEQELQAANISDWPKAFIEGPSPLDEHQAAMAKEELRGLGLDNDLKEQQTKKTAKEAEKTFHEAGKLAFERGIMEGSGGMAGQEAQPAQPAVDPREQELAEREMGVKMREMETRELEATYNFQTTQQKMAVDAEKANREFAIKEMESKGAADREQKFDAALGTVLTSVGTMADAMGLMMKNQDQLAAIMLAPRVLVRDASGQPIASKPDLGGV